MLDEIAYNVYSDSDSGQYDELTATYPTLDAVVKKAATVRADAEAFGVYDTYAAQI